MKNRWIRNILKRFGIRLHLEGALYLAWMIERFRPGDLVTKELYPECGKAFSTNGARVERACRYALAHGGLDVQGMTITEFLTEIYWELQDDVA